MKPVVADWLTRPGGIVERLVAMRSRSGLRGKDLAERLGWTPARVSKLENGRQLPTPDDLRQWAEACGSPEEAENLIDLLGEVQAVHLDWKRRAARGAVALQATHAGMAEDSTVIRDFELVAVPGLLQVPEYMRALFSSLYEVHGIDASVDEAVQARLQRQQVLYHPGKRFEFVLGESVLRYLIVPPEVMVSQLDRLLTAIGMPNVRVGVVPFGVRLDTSLYNAFVLYDDVAVIETFVGESTHKGDEAESYAQIMDRLWAEAVQGDEARQLIIRAAEELRLGA